MAEHDCLYRYRAALDRVVDADTVRMQVDLGMFVHTTQSIRVKDLNAPEIFSGTAEEKAAGQEAKAFVEDWFTAHGAGQWPFVIHTHKDRLSFNRYVADIRTADGRDLASDVIAAGYGGAA